MLGGAMHRAAAHLALLSAVATSLALAACDDKPKPDAEPAPSSAPPPPPHVEAPKPAADKLPDLLVDDAGPLLGSERIEVAQKDWLAKLSTSVGKLPIKGKVVNVVATRTTKTQYVAALVHALGVAGATEIDVKTEPRSGAPMPLKLTPEGMVAKEAADCSVVGMIKKDSTSAVWAIKGGTARKFSRGFAGPDLSLTFEDGLKKGIAGCASTTWFFSGEEGTVWGLAFDLAERVTRAEPPTKATTTVLLHEAPVAGRPVKLAAD